jgi:putative ABC transport system ATP-binding protein
MGPTIRIKNLKLVRNQQPVLNGVQMSIGAGEIVCLLGPSGGGKSSLLRCINRLTEPPPATIFLADTDVTAIDVLALRRQVGMVFQQVSLFPGTVAQNVAYGPALQSRSPSAADVERLLALADLPADFAALDGQSLSGGEAQRVAIARALATEPAATRHVEETMLKLRHELGLTLLWVTHQPEQAKRIADRIYLLVAGQVMDEGPPNHLFGPGSNHLAAAFAAGELD